jgi:hypothetical protein
MSRWRVAIVVSFALVVWSQEHTASAFPSQPSPPVPHLDRGFVDGTTYKNPSLGLELTPDPDLKFMSPELKGRPGSLPLSVTAAAWARFEPGSAREGTVFYADALAYYPPDQRSTDDYMTRVERANQKNGFKSVGGSSEGELGGVLFARTDFTKTGPAYEVVLVRACDAVALVFVFTGPDRDAVNKLIASTALRLDLPTSGCGTRR